MTRNQRNFIIGVAAIVVLVGAFFFIGALGQEHTTFRPVHTTFRPVPTGPGSPYSTQGSPVGMGTVYLALR
jgi:hypothetical protein